MSQSTSSCIETTHQPFRSRHTADDQLNPSFLHLLLSWQIVSFAIHAAFSINGVNAMRSGHVTIQRAAANQGEPLERDHGVLAGRHGGGHGGETHVRGLLWKRSNHRESDGGSFVEV